MFSLMTEQPLAPAQVLAATRLMLQIAHIDGARSAEEAALIRQFYEAGRAVTAAASDLPDFDIVAAAPGGAITAADFPDPRHRDMIVALCLMVAYADGKLSAAESAAVALVARDLGLGETRQGEILALIKDHLLAQLAHLPDADSVAVVAKELG